MSCFTSPGLSDSTFVAPCQWCAKMVTNYSVEKICEKLCFEEFVYFKKTTKSLDSIKIKNKIPLANLIHKSQQLFKNIYKRNLNVKYMCLLFSF